MWQTGDSWIGTGGDGTCRVFAVPQLDGWWVAPLSGIEALEGGELCDLSKSHPLSAP